MSLKSLDLSTMQNLSEQPENYNGFLETSTNGMYSAMNSQLPFHYPKSGAATGNSNLYLSNNSHHDYTYQAHQINGVGSAINSPVSLSNSHYNSSNNSTQTNVSQSPYDPQIVDLAGDKSMYGQSKDVFSTQNRAVSVNPVYPPIQSNLQAHMIHSAQADSSFYNNSNNLFASQEGTLGSSEASATSNGASVSELLKSSYKVAQQIPQSLSALKSANDAQTSFKSEFYSQDSRTANSSAAVKQEFGDTSTVQLQYGNYPQSIQGYTSAPSSYHTNTSQGLQNPQLSSSYIPSGVSLYGSQSASQSQGLMSHGSWDNQGAAYYMAPSTGSLPTQLNLNLSFQPDAAQLSGSQYLSSYSSSSKLSQPYPVNAQQIQLMTASPSLVMSSFGSGYSQNGLVGSARLSGTSSIQLPSHARTWSGDTHCVPHKSLVLRELISIHSLLNDNLVCPPEVHELSTLYVASSKSKKGKPLKIPVAATGRGVSRMSKFKEKYIANHVNRVFLATGIQGQPELCRQRQGENNPCTISREEFVTELASVIDYCVGTIKEAEQNRVSKSDIGINIAQPEIGRGIPMQLSLPEDVPLIIDNRQKTELDNTFSSWKPLRTKPEHFFRMEDRHGQTFSFEELKEALDIILSRPPRRINRYCSRQMLTDVSYGQGRSVTEFNSSQDMTLHMLSSNTRIEYNTVPMGAMSLDISGDMGEEAKQLVHNMNPEDIPYQNSKKGSIYDPIWCRRTGVNKEGWCNHCKDGGWYLMKNSGFLYHKNHEHGVFPQGYVFEDPLVIRRKMIREARWEGQCGICYHWIDLDHTERKNWGTWYRHYKLCCTEYEELKKIVRASGVPLDMIEVEYLPVV